MKTNSLFVVVTNFILLLSTSLSAQWVTGTTGGNNFYQTDASNNIESVGIGDFLSAGFDPDAALHINTNYFSLPNPIAYPNFGEVFLTDCPTDVATYWRMMRGNTLYDNIYNNQDLHFYFEAPEGDIIIRAKGTGTSATTIERMKVSSGIGGNSTGGWGTTNDATKIMMINSDSPTNLDIHGVDAPVLIQLLQPSPFHG